MRQLILIVLFLFPIFSNAQEKIQLSKKLVVSPDKRYIQYEDGRPFFWLGDTGWLLFTQLTREQIQQYLKDRHSKGFNVVQVMVIHELPEVNIYGESAFINNDFSLPKTIHSKSTQEEIEHNYWNLIDFTIDEAFKNDIYLAMVPVWGSIVKKGLLNSKNASTYISWLANRYKNKPNIIWMNGGDIKGTVNEKVLNIVGDVLKATDSNHLVTYHPFGRTSSAEWFHNATWLDFNMVQSGHKDYLQDSVGADNWKLITESYLKKPTKPIIDGEPAYEGIPHGLHDTTLPYWNADDARRYAYWSVFSGSFGHTYGNNSIMQFYHQSSKNKAYGAKKYWHDALNDSGSNQMQYLKQLILSRDFYSRKPAQEIVVDNHQKQYEHVVATKGKDYILVYTFTGKPFKINTNCIAGQSLKMYWYNPKNGQVLFKGKLANQSKPRTFTPPVNSQCVNDWVLVLDDADSLTKIPGTIN